ncbi:hypothetical protein H5410_042970 [Solanum commersonii]|uniref:Uncharacterized protein n=1 Tax=Solanum commersonii TaxID=4109 RepID=A0A9J5XYZ1_SOLCO|nr:hypothetical protein H5410_042970 [Solanum commersonii]
MPMETLIKEPNYDTLSKTWTTGNSPSKSTSTLTLVQLGLVWFLVAISTCKGLSTAAANEKTVSLPKKFGGRDGKDIHAIAVVVSSSGSNIGSHFNVLIGKDQFLCVI